MPVTRWEGSAPRAKGNWSDVLFFVVLSSMLFLLWSSAMSVCVPLTREERARQAGYEAVKIHDAYEQGRQQALKENQR